MKRVLAILLVLCTCVSLCACMSMDKIKDNLGSSYRKTKLDDDDLEVYAELLDLDMDDYDIQSAIEARHKKKYTSVVIIECGSVAKAKQLSEDADEIVDMLEDYYGPSYTFQNVVEGRFVLIGEENCIEDALGE